MCKKKSGKLWNSVALLAEGVDRNYYCASPKGHRRQSPSSRRAWIEIGGSWSSTYWPSVALLAEGVDRNHLCHRAAVGRLGRPPRGGRG